MRARGKSNSSFSIATLLSTTTAERQSINENLGLSANTSNMVLAPSFASSRTARQNQHYRNLDRAHSPHLDPNIIRQGMRSPSEMSASRLSSEVNLLAFMKRHRWNSTRSTTPPLAGSLSAATLKAARTEVYSPSIYSRPASVEECADVPHDLDAAVRLSEWPLRHDEPVCEGDDRSVIRPCEEPEEIALPPSPVPPLEEKPLPPLPESYPSSITTSRAGSPPKRTVRKRRSIFRFLRPGSRRQQIRSVSSPVLLATQPVYPGIYDGPSDEAMLTVQYELTETPQHRRSVTVDNLLQERRPTLAEYERNLTAGGDSRRRPSNVTPFHTDLPKVQMLQDISEDEDIQEQQQSSRLRRKLSRAHALDEAGKTLIGQALRKHQQEKALFRSESKRRDSMAISASSAPLFSSSPFAPTSSSLVPPSIQEFDPLEQQLPNLGQTHLELPPDSSGGQSSLRLTTTAKSFEDAVSRQRSTTVSTRASPAVLEKSASVPARIGTSLSSWTKYPSHTRSLRCESAGAQSQDEVITRDFAIQGRTTTMSSDKLVSPVSKSSSWTSKSKSLIKSPSRTFSKIVQYYTDLFTRPEFRGGNRRTSVSMSSGAVVHPELEMLPPVTGAESHQGAGNEYLREIEERIDAHIDADDALERGEIGQEKERVGAWKNGDTFTFGKAGGGGEETKGNDDDEPSPSDGTTDAGVCGRLTVRKSSEASKASGESRVRHYPSVTVVDDCLGQRASVCLIGNGT